MRNLANARIDLIVGVGNPRWQAISTIQEAANGWVNNKVCPFSNIKYITGGNEVLPCTWDVLYLVNAIRKFFHSRSAVMKDGDHNYRKLFDAILDSFFLCNWSLGYPNVSIIVTGHQEAEYKHRNGAVTIEGQNEMRKLWKSFWRVSFVAEIVWRHLPRVNIKDLFSLRLVRFCQHAYCEHGIYLCKLYLCKVLQLNFNWYWIDLNRGLSL